MSHNLISHNQLAYWELNEQQLSTPDRMTEYVECICDLDNEPNGERACRSILTGQKQSKNYYKKTPQGVFFSAINTRYYVE